MWKLRLLPVGNVTACLRCGGIFNYHFIINLLLNKLINEKIVLKNTDRVTTMCMLSSFSGTQCTVLVYITYSCFHRRRNH